MNTGMGRFLGEGELVWNFVPANNLRSTQAFTGIASRVDLALTRAGTDFVGVIPRGGPPGKGLGVRGVPRDGMLQGLETR